MTVVVANPESFDHIASAGGLRDKSALNPGFRSFTQWFSNPIYRGFTRAAGSLLVRLPRGRRRRHILNVKLQLFADHMRAREWTMDLMMSKTAWSIESHEEVFLY